MIIVPNMKMPKSCSVCSFCIERIDSDGNKKYICETTFKYVTPLRMHTGILKTCPLKEVNKKLLYDEIMEIVKFYSKDIPIKYGDGEDLTEKCVPIYEVEYALKSVLEIEE